MKNICHCNEGKHCVSEGKYCPYDCSHCEQVLPGAFKVGMNKNTICLLLAEELRRSYGKTYKAMDNKDWILGYSQAIKDLESLGVPYPLIVNEPDRCKECKEPLSIRNKKRGKGVEAFCRFCNLPASA